MHVAACAGDAQHTGLFVDEFTEGGGVHVPLFEQVEHNARIEVTRARAHHQSSRRREAHRGVDAHATAYGGHAGPIAKVRDYDAAACHNRIERAQFAHDVLVRQAVEAVAYHAGLLDLARERVLPRHARHVTVERCIEAGRLGDRGIGPARRLDGVDGLWQVVGVDRDQVPQRRDHLVGDQLGFAIAAAAMDDAVAGRVWPRRVAALTQPVEESL